MSSVMKTMSLVESMRQDVGYLVCTEQMPELLAWVKVLAAHVRSAMMPLVCKRLGHRLVEGGYAGPDSGAMDVSCERCGIGWHHQLY